MKSRFLLELRLQRFEFAVVTAGSILLSLSGLGFALLLGSYQLAPDCLALDALPAQCDLDVVNEFYASTRLGDALYPAIGLWPWIAGLLLGVGVVAREIEHRTAPLIWTVVPSRRRWVLRRAAVLMSVLTVVVAFPAFVAVAMQAAERPLIDPLATFEHHQARGPLLVARAILGFAVATLAGAVLGRLLPALVATLLAGLVLWVASTLAFPYLKPPQELSTVEQGLTDPGAIILGSHYRLATGESFFSFADLVAQAPFADGTRDFRAWFRANVTQVPVGYPGSAAFDLNLRESGITLILSGIVIAGTVRVVDRRKPY